jgi:hypothetical protein
MSEDNSDLRQEVRTQTLAYAVTRKVLHGARCEIRTHDLWLRRLCPVARSTDRSTAWPTPGRKEIHEHRSRCLENLGLKSRIRKSLHLAHLQYLRCCCSCSAANKSETLEVKTAKGL